MLTDAHILEAKSGDRHAVNAFLTACVPVVRTMCRRVLADSPYLDDAVQESLIKLWRNLHSYHGGNLVNWVAHVATNAARDVHLSAAQRHLDSHVSIDTVWRIHGGGDPAASLLRNEGRRLVRDAICALQLEQQPVAWLMHVEGCKAREAAAVLGVPMATVYDRDKRARQELTAMLRDAA